MNGLAKLVPDTGWTTPGYCPGCLDLHVSQYTLAGHPHVECKRVLDALVSENPDKYRSRWVA